MRVAIILVHYHTADFLRKAVTSLRADLDSSGLDADLIVVDNGSREQERRSLSGLPVRWIDAGSNLGYAGGVNLGVRRADADAFIFMNCDIEVLPGCIGALVQTLKDGAFAAGPKFFWDRAQTILIPPTEERTFQNEILKRLGAQYGGAWANMARSRWRRHARRHWLAETPLPSYSLSGGLLAVTRAAWEDIGPFDETFQLYFEETDWLKRLEQKRSPARYQPFARAVHFHNQSAVQQPQARQWYGQSAEIFEKRHYNWCARQLLNKLSGRSRAGCASAPVMTSGLLEVNKILSGLSACEWIEISPERSGFPAAGVHVGGRGPWLISEELWSYMSPGTYSLQVVDRAGCESQQLFFAVPTRAYNLENGGQVIANAV